MGKCIICEAELGEVLLHFEDMPASAQNIPKQEELENERGISLNLYQCPQCGLVQFDCVPVNYYRDVIRSGGYSTTMVKLRKNQFQHLISNYDLKDKKFIEIGCGKGEFLSILNDFPVETYGIENNRQFVEIAKNNGLNVEQCFMEDERIKLNNAPFDVFLSFNFLEHQPNPNGMLRGIYNNLTPEGMGLITVPSFEYIMDNSSYYEFIRDHLAYYTFDSLCFLLRKNGFEILEQEMINRDTISVIVKKRKTLRLDKIKNNYLKISDEINQYVGKKEVEQKTVAIWGASHQGFTLASTLHLTGKVKYIIDSAPFKQGKYAPASHIPIVAPEYAEKNPVDAIIIMAPGYTNEIAKIINEKHTNKVEIAVMMSENLQMYKDIKA